MFDPINDKSFFSSFNFSFRSLFKPFKSALKLFEAGKQAFKNAADIILKDSYTRAEEQYQRELATDREIAKARFLAKEQRKQERVLQNMEDLKVSPLKSFFNAKDVSDFPDFINGFSDKEVSGFKEIDLIIIQDAFQTLSKENYSLKLDAADLFLHLSKVIPDREVASLCREKSNRFFKAYNSKLSSPETPASEEKPLEKTSENASFSVKNMQHSFLKHAVTIDDIKLRIDTLINEGKFNETECQSLVEFCKTMHLVKEVSIDGHKYLEFNHVAPPVTQDFMYEVYKSESNPTLKAIFSNFAKITDLAKTVVKDGQEFLSFERPSEQSFALAM